MNAIRYLRGKGNKRSIKKAITEKHIDRARVPHSNASSRNEKVVVAAGTFDILHPGHLHYLSHAKKYGRLVVIVASDEQASRYGKMLVHTQQERLELVRSLRVVDEAVPGDEKNQLKLVEKLKPDIIYLGYDQKMPEGLEQYCKENEIKVLRDECSSNPQRHKTTKIKERIRGSEPV